MTVVARGGSSSGDRRQLFPSYAERQSAIVAAERIKGVRAVLPELNVRLPSHHQRSDDELAHAVADGLEWDALVPNGHVRAVVENG